MGRTKPHLEKTASLKNAVQDRQPQARLYFPDAAPWVRRQRKKQHHRVSGVALFPYIVSYGALSHYTPALAVSFPADGLSHIKWQCCLSIGQEFLGIPVSQRPTIICTKRRYLFKTTQDSKSRLATGGQEQRHGSTPTVDAA
jgi:hypothetical protein